MLDTSDDHLAKIVYTTHLSPPTNVTWLRDGEPVMVDGYRYEMKSTVTNRYYHESHYRSKLLIRDAIHLAGNHTYTCIVSNYAGTASSTVETSLTGDQK